MSEKTAARAEEPVSNWNLPNALTVLRILLVPVLLVVLFMHPHDRTWRWASAGVFTLAMLTDLADGRIARSRGLVTDFGKLWDPVADKLMTGAAFISLALLDELPWFFVVLILLREWGITWLRAATRKYGVMAAGSGGKAKTVTQTLALILFLMWLPTLPDAVQVLAWIIMWVALVLTLSTAWGYIKEAARLRREARNPAPRRAA